eukprot:8349587-Karenia_brevis.AAC.1
MQPRRHGHLIPEYKTLISVPEHHHDQVMLHKEVDQSMSDLLNVPVGSAILQSKTGGISGQDRTISVGVHSVSYTHLTLPTICSV